MALVVDLEVSLRQLVEEFGRVWKKSELRVNWSKSKIIKCTSLEDMRKNLALNVKLLEEVECFEYVELNVTVNRRIGAEVSL